MNAIESFNTTFDNAKKDSSVLAVINTAFIDSNRYSLISFVEGYDDLTKKKYTSDKDFANHVKAVISKLNKPFYIHLTS